MQYSQSLLDSNEALGGGAAAPEAWGSLFILYSEIEKG